MVAAQAVSCGSIFVFSFHRICLWEKLDVDQEKKKFEIDSINICSKVWRLTALHRLAASCSTAVNHQEIPVFKHVHAPYSEW